MIIGTINFLKRPFGISYQRIFIGKQFKGKSVKAIIGVVDLHVMHTHIIGRALNQFGNVSQSASMISGSNCVPEHLFNS